MLLPEPTWACNWESRASCVVLRYGGAWLPAAAAARAFADRSVAGLVFVCIASGQCCTVHLPRQTHAPEDGMQLHVCPSKGLVLVHQCSNTQHALSVYTCSGVLANCRQLYRPFAHDLQHLWSASGASVTMLATLRSTAHFWQLSSQEISLLQPASWAAWATPSSDRLLLGRASFVTCHRLSSDLSLVYCGTQQLPACKNSRCAVWGSMLAVLACDAGRATIRNLLIYAENEDAWSLQTILSARNRQFLQILQLSPAGELCAAVTANIGHPLECQLAIVTLASGAMRTFPLLDAELADSIHEPLAVTFSVDCTAVLVTSTCSHRCQVFRFRADAL